MPKERCSFRNGKKHRFYQILSTVIGTACDPIAFFKSWPAKRDQQPPFILLWRYLHGCRTKSLPLAKDYIRISFQDWACAQCNAKSICCLKICWLMPFLFRLSGDQLLVSCVWGKLCACSLMPEFEWKQKHWFRFRFCRAWKSRAPCGECALRLCCVFSWRLCRIARKFNLGLVTRGQPGAYRVRGKKQVKRPYVWTWDLLGVNALYWGKYLWHC